MDTERKATAKAGLRDIAVNGLKLVGCLAIVAFFWGGPSTRAWMGGFLFGLTSSLLGEPNATQAADAAKFDAPPLRLLDHNCREESAFQICEGEIRNISGERLENVMVEVRFQDRAGRFIKSEDAMVEYQPLMPDQTSPFKVAASNNPLIRHYTISFKQMFGGELKVAR